VWLSPISGGAPVRLTNTTGTIRPWRDAPTWSPDGEWIAFVHNDEGKPGLVKTRIGTTERVDVLPGALAFTRPVWSPDGKWIATQTDEGLVRVSADGGKPEVLSSAPILAVTWRPDSRRVVALSESDTPGHFSMIEIDTNSKDVQVLNPDLGPIPIANQPIRGLSFITDQGFLTSLASARSDIWLLEGFQPPQRGFFRLPR
jgi:Tol biopolymer transport system component